MPSGDSQGSPATSLIWERLAPGTRGPRPGLTHDQITREAMTLADAEGLGAVTIRGVAARLGVGTMSLYRYVAAKEDLLDLILDAAYAEIQTTGAATGDWQADLRTLAQLTRGMLRSHPWAATLLATRPPLGPAYLRHFERSLAAVAHLGLSIADMVRMTSVLYGFVAGVATYEAAEQEADRRLGMTEAQKRTSIEPYVHGLVATGELPQFSRFLSAAPDLDPERGFEFGLDRILAGLAAWLHEQPH